MFMHSKCHTIQLPGLQSASCQTTNHQLPHSPAEPPRGPRADELPHGLLRLLLLAPAMQLWLLRLLQRWAPSLLLQLLLLLLLLAQEAPKPVIDWGLDRRDRYAWST